MQKNGKCSGRKLNSTTVNPKAVYITQDTKTTQLHSDTLLEKTCIYQVDLTFKTLLYVYGRNDI